MSPTQTKIQMTSINIEDINSAGIAYEAKKAGIETVNLIGTYEHPEHPGSNDWTIRLYEMGDVRVIDTNGDPIWEESHPVEFAETLAAYGVE